MNQRSFSDLKNENNMDFIKIIHGQILNRKKKIITKQLRGSYIIVNLLKNMSIRRQHKKNMQRRPLNLNFINAISNLVHRERSSIHSSLLDITNINTSSCDISRFQMKPPGQAEEQKSIILPEIQRGGIKSSFHEQPSFSRRNSKSSDGGNILMKSEHERKMESIEIERKKKEFLDRKSSQSQLINVQSMNVYTRFGCGMNEKEYVKTQTLLMINKKSIVKDELKLRLKKVVDIKNQITQELYKKSKIEEKQSQPPRPKQLPPVFPHLSNCEDGIQLKNRKQNKRKMKKNGSYAVKKKTLKSKEENILHKQEESVPTYLNSNDISRWEIEESLEYDQHRLMQNFQVTID